jgi:hypothetical protein
MTCGELAIVVFFVLLIAAGVGLHFLLAWLDRKEFEDR